MICEDKREMEVLELACFASRCALTIMDGAEHRAPNTWGRALKNTRHLPIAGPR
jgi:hypothetical protein